MTRATNNSEVGRVLGIAVMVALIGVGHICCAADASPSDSVTRRPATRSGQTAAAHATTSLSPEWFDRHLTDPALRELAATRFADHRHLTRLDMIAIFRLAAGSDRINDDQFQTLHTLAENAKLLGMSAVVADLARKVVLGDPANAHFRGQPLGDLEPGRSGKHLEALVQKWFFGADHPQIDSKFHYQRAAGVLFDGAPKLSNLHQGDLGDCFFLAALGEVALRNPEQIQHMFGDNHDGTFNVRFYRDGKPVFLTVDRYLPVDEKGRFVYENRGDSASNAKNVLWLALAEKALAQLNESGWLTTKGAAGVNSFAEIGLGGKSTMTLPLLTGVAASRDGLNTIAALAKGELELANSKSEVPDSLVPHHSYVIVGYDPASEQVTLYNPWGLRGNKKNIKYGTFSVSWQDFWAEFGSIDHVPVKGGAGPAKNPARMAMSPKNVPNRTTGEQTVH
jgi:Calpain family cysteine protease